VLQGGGVARRAWTAELLTAREVAQRLRVCTATVYRLCEKGALEHVRIANAVRVPYSALRKFLENNKR
jgi:excisionase family DNA binding protein